MKVERMRARSRSFRLSPPAPRHLELQAKTDRLLPPISLPLPSTLWWSARATMYPISDLTTFCRKALGDVPPKLVVCTPLFYPSSFVLILISRAHRPPLSVPRSIYMYGQPSPTPHLPTSDSPRPTGWTPRRRASNGYRHLHVRH